jgi:hypothetical protein
MSAHALASEREQAIATACATTRRMVAIRDSNSIGLASN